MKIFKIAAAVMLCLALLLSISCCAKKVDEPSASSQTVSRGTVCKYSTKKFDDVESAEISDFLKKECGERYIAEGTGDEGFELHYTPKYTVSKDGIEYTIVIITMDVPNFETGEIAYVSNPGSYAINDEHTEIYRAEIPNNGMVEIDFSANLKK